MSACLMVGAVAVTLASGTFTLSWTHSVERTGWRESWAVAPEGLRLTGAAVKGSGAGMDPGPGATLSADGWWEWAPDLPPQASVSLAASGATGGGWTLCADGACRTLGAVAGTPVILRPCDGADAKGGAPKDAP